MSELALSADATPVIENDSAGESTGSPRDDSWWGRPGGGREVLTIATPLVVSSLSWTVMTFVDRMMLNNWSGGAMAAAFVGGVLWFAVICLPLGLCSYVGTFVAQYHGSGQPERIGPSVWQGVWATVAVTPLMLAPILFSQAGFQAAGHTPETVALETTYFDILCWGSPAMLASAALSSFWSGRGKTWVVMIVDSVFAGLNLLLDWWWIFGLTATIGGETITLFPAAGIAGAGWATVVSLWLKTFTYTFLMLSPRNRAEFGAGVCGIDRPLLRRVLTFGFPAGVQMLLDVLGFSAFILIVGRIGAVEHEASSLTFSLNHLSFMPVVGFGMAASILVGQHLGENRDRVAARATWTSLQISWAYMALMSMAFIFAPGVFLAGFFQTEGVSGDAAHRAAVASTAVVLMRFIAAYNMLDAMMIVFVSALKGAGDTRFILFASLVMASLLALLTWMAVEVFGFGVYGCWALISLWIASLGTIFFIRFQLGYWRSMRVIERTPIVEAEALSAE
ncbi:MATE family efflux transporter [Botrimarina mediterranea]|uniref:Multidrug-efflux transporter n=1 Tax=Botrimarina mediterranea TaxID=2528022 RepID=A0A518K3P6_9BACT|nr:MATE family efflux transporter [Botrimarina mediterranea]QDV72385.1 Multidrug resistance protein NorM [Botrimarina mediterranea]QDV76931.1 Multidrug resistance protein NorM [Planctomycetes bacterium K2D]